MGTTIKPYNRAQNNYASGVSRTNEENIRVVAAKQGLETKCCIKVVPVDIQGTVLTGATVTLNGTAGTVAAVGNVIYVAPFADAVTVKVELAGYITQEFTIPVADVDVLKEVTLIEGESETEPSTPEDPSEDPSENPDEGDVETEGAGK